MTVDLNIKDNNWDLLYPHHSTYAYANTLREIVDLMSST